MYGDMQMFAVVEIGSGDFPAGGGDFTLQALETNDVGFLVPGLSLDTDVIMSVNCSSDLNHAQYVVFTPSVIADGEIRLSIFNNTPFNGSQTYVIPAGTLFKFTIGRSRSKNSGVLS